MAKVQAVQVIKVGASTTVSNIMGRINGHMVLLAGANSSATIQHCSKGFMVVAALPSGKTYYRANLVSAIRLALATL